MSVFSHAPDPRSPHKSSFAQRVVRNYFGSCALPKLRLEFGGTNLRHEVCVRDSRGVYKKVAPRLGQHSSAAGTLSAEFGTPRSGVGFSSTDATFSCGRPTKSGVGFCNLDRARQVRGGGAQSSAAPICGTKLCTKEHGARTIATSSAVGTRAEDNQRAERHTLRTLRRM